MPGKPIDPLERSSEKTTRGDLLPVDEELVAFCEAQRPRLVGFLGLYCGDAQVAEELAHDAIAKTCQRWRHVRGMVAPDAWVYRVALNLAASHFRRIAAERRARARFPNPEHSRKPTGTTRSPFARPLPPFRSSSEQHLSCATTSTYPSPRRPS